ELEYLETQLSMKRDKDDLTEFMDPSCVLPSGTVCASEPPATEPERKHSSSLDYTITQGEPSVEDVLKDKDGNEYYGMWNVDKRAQFPGGFDSLTSFMEENLHYPPELKGIHGRVIVQFFVGMDGSISNVEVWYHGRNPLMDDEAVKLIQSMPNWIPAEKDGKAVRSFYRLQVGFSSPK
ncbi:MAG: energy transducer TonB, partial [Paludibacteraceae bacterium]|nr:energy transducer TonB [Paludibacteraceae bacterium]